VGVSRKHTHTHTHTHTKRTPHHCTRQSMTVQTQVQMLQEAQLVQRAWKMSGRRREVDSIQTQCGQRECSEALCRKLFREKQRIESEQR
jgi:hypothetical protein